MRGIALQSSKIVGEGFLSHGASEPMVGKGKFSRLKVTVAAVPLLELPGKRITLSSFRMSHRNDREENRNYRSTLTNNGVPRP